jgi:zinc and cadmium transporter
MDILLATLLVASLSLAGILVFGRTVKHGFAYRYVIPFAIGTFLAVVFFELIPETLALAPGGGAFAIVGGFLLFYALAHYLSAYHHHHDADNHDDACDASPQTAKTLLVGDAIHNFVDGVVIASAFFVNPVLGWFTTLGVALHEAPQEIAEYGVLRHAGYSPRAALQYNLLSALSVVVGGVVTMVIGAALEDMLWVLTGIAAGNLLYVAMSDLIPNVAAKARTSGQFVDSFIVTVAGFVLITALISYAHSTFGHEHGHEHEDEYHVVHEGEEHQGESGIYDPVVPPHESQSHQDLHEAEQHQEPLP